MTMSVELGQLEQVVERLVKQGRFGSKSEVLREGVRLVEEREAKLALAYAELQKGIDEADAGRLIPLEDAIADLRQHIRAEAG